MIDYEHYNKSFYLNSENYYDYVWFNSGINPNITLKPNRGYMHDIIPGANPVVQVFPAIMTEHFVEVYL